MAKPAKNGLTACPHCGGDNGFHTKEIVDYRAFYSWGGTFEQGEHNRTIRGGNAFYCCDCGRNITQQAQDETL